MSENLTITAANHQAHSPATDRAGAEHAQATFFQNKKKALLAATPHAIIWAARNGAHLISDFTKDVGAPAIGGMVATALGRYQPTAPALALATLPAGLLLLAGRGNKTNSKWKDATAVMVTAGVAAAAEAHAPALAAAMQDGSASAAIATVTKATAVAGEATLAIADQLLTSRANKRNDRADEEANTHPAPPVAQRRAKYTLNARTILRGVMLGLAAGGSTSYLTERLAPAQGAGSGTGYTPPNVPSLPENWLELTQHIEGNYTDLAQNFLNATGDQIVTKVAGLQTALAAVGGHANLVGALGQQTFNVTGFDAYTRYSLFQPIEAAAQSDGVTLAKAKGVIDSSNFDPTGKPLSGALNATADSQANLGDCVTVARFNSEEDIASGREVANNSIKDDGNGFYTTRFQGAANNATIPVAPSDTNNPANVFISGNAGAQALFAGINKYMIGQGGAGIGYGLSGDPIGPLLNGNAAGRQTVSAEGMVPAQVAKFQLVLGAASKDVAVTLDGSVGPNTQWTPNSPINHRFSQRVTLLDNVTDPKLQPVAIRNPWNPATILDVRTIENISTEAAGAPIAWYVENFQKDTSPPAPTPPASPYGIDFNWTTPFNDTGATAGGAAATASSNSPAATSFGLNLTSFNESLLRRTDVKPSPATLPEHS